MTWSRGALNNGLIQEAIKMHLSVILVLSHTVLELYSRPLNAFQNCSGVFLLQTSILLMVIWDQISNSVKVFCDRVTVMIVFWIIYNNKKAYSLCVFCISASCGDDSLRSAAKSKKNPWKKKSHLWQWKPSTRMTGMLQFTFSWRIINMDFRNIRSDGENPQCELWDLKSVNLLFACANHPITTA